MNKKILVIVALLTFSMLLSPLVFAKPEKGQKVPITIHLTTVSNIPVSDKITGNVIHRVADVLYDIAIDVDGVPTYTGTLVVTRNVLIMPREGGAKLILRDDNVMTINGIDGTFEGQSVIVIEGYDLSAIPPYERGKNHNLLQGTGDLEGQTINSGHHWVPAGPITWYGYWLKP
jgi:hypothetical protein